MSAIGIACVVYTHPAVCIHTHTVDLPDVYTAVCRILLVNLHTNPAGYGSPPTPRCRDTFFLIFLPVRPYRGEKYLMLAPDLAISGIVTVSIIEVLFVKAGNPPW